MSFVPLPIRMKKSFFSNIFFCIKQMSYSGTISVMFILRYRNIVRWNITLYLYLCQLSSLLSRYRSFFGHLNNRPKINMNMLKWYYHWFPLSVDKEQVWELFTKCKNSKYFSRYCLKHLVIWSFSDLKNGDLEVFWGWKVKILHGLTRKLSKSCNLP